MSDSLLKEQAATIAAAMQRASLLADLQRAESQVVAAKKRVAVQIDAIAWLSWFGDDSVEAEAKALLRKFEIALAKHLSERERLRMQLALLEGTDATGSPGHAQRRLLPTESSQSRLSA
jgi:hypothetical protein